MNKRSLLATPYIIWIIGFTVLPILMIVFYALGDGNGGFTLANILAIFQPVHLKSLLLALWLALLCTAICLVLAYPLAEIEHRKTGNDGDHRDPADVGKFCTAYHGMAAIVIQKRYYQCTAWRTWTAGTASCQFQCGNCNRYGI